MMTPRNIYTFALIFIVLVLVGCGGAGSPTFPNSGISGNSTDTSILSNKTLWGLWNVSMNMETMELETYQHRTAMFTANVNNLLEGKPGNLLLENMDITNFFTEGRLDVTVTLKHPLPGLTQYNGFDVWGVFMHNGSTPLDYDGLLYSDGTGTNEAVMLNPDGWARWYNYEEFNGSGLPILKFWPGKLANLPNPGATLNPYKIYADTLGAFDDYHTWITTSGNADNRGIFKAGMANSRRYELKFPMIGGAPKVDFQYAVIASWEPGDPTLTGNPDIYEPMDFPISANALEAFFIKVDTLESDLYYEAGVGNGGSFKADIEVFDWQGGIVANNGVPNEISRMILEADFFPGGTYEIPNSTLQTLAIPATPNSSVFQVDIPNCSPVASGLTDVWVIVESDEDYDQGFGTPYPPDAKLAQFMRGSVDVDDTAPVPDDTYHLELNDEITFNTSLPDFTPCVLQNWDDDVYIMWLRNYYDLNNTTTDYAISYDSGATWDEPFWAALGGYVDGDDSAPAIDAVGDMYYHILSHNIYTWTAIVRFNFAYDYNYQSGLFQTPSIYGRSFHFTYDGYPLCFGDYTGAIRYKKGLEQNSPLSGQSWPGGWSSTPEYQAVPSPSRLSKTMNIGRLADNSIWFVYFSSLPTDKWIRLAYNADGNGLTWNHSNAIYDGTADGYDSASDPSLEIDNEEIFHSSFILRKSSPSAIERIAYSTSSNGTSWSSPVIAYEYPGTGVIKDPTVRIVYFDNHKFIVLTWQIDNDIYIGFSQDDAATWETPLKLSSTLGSKPDTCVTSDGFIHNVWESDDVTDKSIRYRRAFFVKD